MHQVHGNETEEKRVYLERFKMHSIVIEKQPGQPSIVDRFGSPHLVMLYDLRYDRTFSLRF